MMAEVTVKDAQGNEVTKEYEYIGYPKMFYKSDGSSCTVQNAEEHQALKGQWAESPDGPFGGRGGSSQ